MAPAHNVTSPEKAQAAKGRRPKVVGLTGGIAAGKTSVARMFAALGAVVVDADQLAREVVEPGTPVFEHVVRQFGPGVLDAAGRLDRALMGQLVFSDPAARRSLEAITHPAIAEAFERRLQAVARRGHVVVVYEAALLVECGRHRDVDVLVVVVAADAQRIERLIGRDNITEKQARQRLAAQLPQKRKAELADHVIDNSGTPADTQLQVERVWQQIEPRHK